MPAWDKINAVLGGTRAMRAAGKKFLPQHPKERSKAFSSRLNCAVLVNMAQLTLDTWVGRPFSDPVKISDDTPATVKAVLDDVDLRGNAVGVFAREWFQAGLSKGFAHILVDFPTVPQDGTRTMADDKRDNLRPYWSLIRPENLIFAAATIWNGKEVLTHVRIRETVVKRVGWAEQAVERIRVFDAHPDGTEAMYSVYEKNEKDQWLKIGDAQKLGIGVIPLVTFYAGAREGLMLAKPPLEDLVDLNIAHWQSGAEQRHVLTVARFPVLAGSGISADETTEEMVIAPDRTLTTPDPSGKWYYVEHSGAAIQAGERDMDKLEVQMAHYGAEFLRRRPGRETATARALDEAGTTSPIEDAAIRFNDNLARAMALTGTWMNEPAPGSVQIPVDLGPDAAEQADFQLLQAARAGRDISRKTLVTEMKRRGTLAEEFDPEEDLAELKSEDQFGAASIDIDPASRPGKAAVV